MYRRPTYGRRQAFLPGSSPGIATDADAEKLNLPTICPLVSTLA